MIVGKRLLDVKYQKVACNEPDNKTVLICNVIALFMGYNRPVCFVLLWVTTYHFFFLLMK